MRLIRETKNVGSDVYERTVGCSLNLHELVENVERANFEIRDSKDEDSFYVGDEVEYEVFVSGKPVDSSKVTIAIYDQEDYKPDYWECVAIGEEVSTDTLEYAQMLSKMSKEELIKRLLEE